MPGRKHPTIFNWLRSFTIAVLIGFLLPSASVFAQGPSPASHRAFALEAGLTSLSEAALPNTSIAPMAVTGNFIQDGGFEAYDAQAQDDPYWDEHDSSFTTPLCNGLDCGGYFVEAQPHSGAAWGWFGGVQEPIHTASLSQGVVLPACTSATLQFYFWIGYAQAGSGTNDVFTARMDGTPLFTANAAQKNSYSQYTLISLNVTAFANGATHTLEFSHTNTVQDVIFNLDDVSLTENCSTTISGNVGVGGATLSFINGVPQTVISQPDGSYILPVSNNWSGTVTPTHPCYLFSPVSRTYTNVTASQSTENYIPTFNPAPACKVTTGVFRPGNGLLYLKNSNVSGFADIALNYGLGGDYPVVGDWDGNGTDTIGVYRNGTFYLRNENTIGFAEIVFPFGNLGDQPIAGDWNNDGVDTIGVYRPSTGQFLLRNTNSEGVEDISFFLGNVGDVGIAGDWNGDGIDTTGVFRPSDGLLYLKNSNTSGFADIALNYGLPGDKPVTGDWDGNGTDTIGVYRGATFYLRNENTIGFANIIFDLGNPGDMPIAGNWDALP